VGKENKTENEVKETTLVAAAMAQFQGSSNASEASTSADHPSETDSHKSFDEDDL
jgi:hypothetical protein